MDREAWLDAIHGGHKESDTTERLNWTELIEDKENPKIHQKLELVYELSTTAR